MYSHKLALLTVTALAALANTASAIDFTGAYSENFDELGTMGTTLPAGFTSYVGDGGSNSTWTNVTGIPATGMLSVTTMTQNNASLTATTTPSGTNVNGFNAAASSTTASDRVLASSPTGITGVAFNLVLTNTTGAGINALNLGYTILRYTAVSTANELPGYQVFTRIDGGAWSNVAAFNPTLDGANGTIAVPNTVGLTVVSSTAFTLSSTWNAGSNLDIRWVDDNAVQTSPDQIVGLNNITLTANPVPEPSTWAAMLLGVAGFGVIRFRRRTSRFQMLA